MLNMRTSKSRSNNSLVCLSLSLSLSLSLTPLLFPCSPRVTLTVVRAAVVSTTAARSVGICIQDINTRTDLEGGRRLQCRRRLFLPRAVVYAAAVF